MGYSVAWQIRNIKDIMLVVKIEMKVSQVENGAHGVICGMAG